MSKTVEELLVPRYKVCGIYKITSPTGRVYIGQSIDIINRIKSYERLYCNKQPLIYASIKKYGWGKHRLDILHECVPQDLNKLEEYYVNLYGCFNSKSGMNLKDGGGGRGKLSAEAKLKISKRHKGRPRTEREKAVLDKMRLLNIGKPRPLSVRSAIGLKNKQLLTGRKRSKADQRARLKNGKYLTSKLDASQVHEIRMMLLNGIDNKVIWEKFNVTKSSIYRIRDGKSWGHLPILPATLAEYQSYINQKK